MNDNIEKKTIGVLLKEFGLVTEQDIEEAYQRQQSSGQKLGEVLVEMGKITEEDIEWILAKQLDIPFIIVDDKTADVNLMQKFSKDFLMVNRIVPMYETDTEIAIVTDDPLNDSAFETIEEKFSKTVAVNTGHGESLDAILQKVFKHEGSPEIVSLLGKIFERLAETCLYRIDFILKQNSLKINAFGFGILKEVYSSPDSYTKDDIFSALLTMDIGYLYREYEGAEGSNVFSIFPMDDEFKPQAYPVVLANFGLALPEDTMFTDLKVMGLDNVYTSPTPVDGYDFFTDSGYTGRSEQIVQTIDSAPAEFRNCYVKVYIPTTCPACGGAGCAECGHLGLVFKLMDAIYSYNDIMTVLKQV